MKLSSLLSTSRVAFTTLALALTAGCGVSDPEPTTPEPTTPGDTDSTGPLYAIITQLLTADTPQSYIVLTNKLDGNATLALDKAIEVPSRSLGMGIPKSGALYVAGDEDATVTRYNLTAKGTLEKGDTVSFAGKGVASIGEYQTQFQFASPTKAYYFDGRTSQVIVWNPTEMTVTGSISLPGLAITGAITTFASSPVVTRENQIIMPVGWRPSSVVGITKQAGVVVVDTRTDTATLVTDDRCGYVRDGVLGPDGQVYLATEVYGAAVHRVTGGDTPEPCLLKFDPSSLTFDPDFYKELNSFANGGTVGTILPGPQGTAYVRVLDEQTYPIQAGVHPRQVASAAAWKWSQLKLDTFTATPIETLPVSTGSTFLYQAQDQILFTQFAAGSSGTTLHQLTGETGKPQVNSQGLIFSFVQLR
ncbi:hypothetical protein [Melittangium boletus]|uniref:MxcI protein n=1 Tax=Melittangium boletus DSM 14713 TaxID=1294270 RepID=A0A250I8F6_9BACT|nr:hypothetical protein [Melittangium boletus]ATB27490.1 hypothetical protein MEBOL_000932 [Melittangium boletus DSM 14713]